jgi:thymidylate synthase (FAD)
MPIEFVSKSKVELVHSRASDKDVALAAWVSNFAKSDIPVSIPNDNHIKSYLEMESKRDNAPYKDGKSYRDYWYPDVKPYLDRVGGLINFLYRERHMSPFEHGSFTFYIDTPIFVAREFMRHRTWSYNETSGRYKELQPRFYLIDDERPITQKGKVGAYRFETGSPEQYGTIYADTTLSYANSWNAYQNMLKNGVAKEVARNVLPVGTMTQFYATANPRNVMQFLLLRNDANALKEIRDVAVRIEEEFAKAMPLTYEAFKKYDWRDEKAELELLRKRVAQLEAELTYGENIHLPPRFDVPAGSPFSTRGAW